MTIRIKNWSHFQHFKDRRPPWVKLYRELLDDMDWHELEPKAAKILVSLWLIASEFDGELPGIKRLAFRLRITEKETLDVIFKLSHWLEQDDINPISERYQVDAPETETETEKSREDTSPAKLPTCPTQAIVDMYHEVLPELPTVRLMDDKRKRAIAGLWRFALTSKKPDGQPRAQDAEEAKVWTRQFFERARVNDFLMGRNAREGAHANWKCDLDFLLTDKGMKHVIEKTRDTA